MVESPDREPQPTPERGADMLRKRIVICADGTWNDPEDERATNVLRVARAIRPADDDA